MRIDALRADHPGSVFLNESKLRFQFFFSSRAYKIYFFYYSLIAMGAFFIKLPLSLSTSLFIPSSETSETLKKLVKSSKITIASSYKSYISSLSSHRGRFAPPRNIHQKSYEDGSLFVLVTSELVVLLPVFSSSESEIASSIVYSS